MFGLFKPKPPFEPLTAEARHYFHTNMQRLEQAFPEPAPKDRKVFCPTQEDFPLVWDHTEDMAFGVLDIITRHMQIDREEVLLLFFDSGARQLGAGRQTLFLETKDGAAGYFLHKNEEDKYKILIDRKQLKQPDSLIATLAHELAHVKLLGHLGLEKNDEYLTDLATVFFGFGIFNAGTSFQFYKNKDVWGYNTLGYLKQEEWAYALAVWAFVRGETEPEWSRYLGLTLKKDFDRSLQYIREHYEITE